uniref:Beta-(1-->2)glucan export ATP-binding/permease protein NdvA n=1 Tax=Anthurium amnicola TaxID=1678845 RepID=A0A1D1YZP7_9ARAE
MTRKFIISFLIILFVITFTNSLPMEENSISIIEEKPIDKRQTTDTGPFVAFADFEHYDPYDEIEEPVSGRITFTKISNNTIRLMGQCNTGFTDPDPNMYTIFIAERPMCSTYIKEFDLTPFLKYFINVPGTSAFQFDFVNKFTLPQIIGNFVIVKLGGTTIGVAPIYAVGGQQ